MDTTAPPDSRHQIKARRLRLDYERETLPRHFMDDDLIMSHLTACLSAVFPEGEDYFVRSVRRFRDQIDDPELKRQVAGFIGQESNHGREHRNFNDRLHRLGYPTKRIDRWLHKTLRWDERFRSAESCLATTAALEHYTATIAEIILEDERSREYLTVPEVRDLLLWHALEESEHKAVAFDVFQHVSGDTKLRRRTMNQVTVGFLLEMAFHTITSLITDREAWDLPRLRASLARFRVSPFMTKGTWRRLRDYNRVDFHPNDNDNDALTSKWRTKLFGEAGVLLERVKTAGV